MQKITAHLWFDNQAEEAMKFYTSVFKNSKIISIKRYPDESLDEHFKDKQNRRSLISSGGFVYFYTQ